MRPTVNLCLHLPHGQDHLFPQTMLKASLAQSLHSKKLDEGQLGLDLPSRPGPPHAQSPSSNSGQCLLAER